MIYKNGSNAKIEEFKSRIGLTGDVYLIHSHLMESLESHKRLFPNSTATTIEEAEGERYAYEEQLRTQLEQEQQESLANESKDIEEESTVEEPQDE